MLMDNFKKGLRKAFHPPVSLIKNWVKEPTVESPLLAEIPVSRRQIPHPQAHLFPQSGPLPWLDEPNALEEIKRRRKAGMITELEASLCAHWAQEGYVIVEGVFDSAYLDAVWEAYERAVKAGSIVLPEEKAGEADPHPGRALNPHLKVIELNAMLCDPLVMKWIRLLLGREPYPFQTITGHKGSQQLEHSDSIHMTTYPLGYLAATWTAFEKISADSGPLIYYPRSHRLPYALNREVGMSPDEYEKNPQSYQEKYEPFIQNVIKEHKLKPAYFTAKKGDVLIWHSNLLHGGSPRKNLALARKALVCHYFGRGALCYHEMVGSYCPTDRAIDPGVNN